MFDGKRSQVNVFEAADIDSRHALARRVGPFAIVVDAAGRAETMPDGVLVEQIRAGIFVRRQASGVRRQQAQCVPRNEPEKRPLARTDGAIARQHLGVLAVNFERDPPAVAATFVCHGLIPFFHETARGEPEVRIFTTDGYMLYRITLPKSGRAIYTVHM